MNLSFGFSLSKIGGFSSIFRKFALKTHVLALVSILLSVFCVVGCAKRDGTFYVRRGNEIQSQLIVELETVQTLPDLFGKQEALSSLFDELARVAIEARRYQIRTHTSWETSIAAAEKSRELEVQMQRVLQIPGARAFLEKCQSRGFERIDAFEKAILRPDQACSRGMR